MIKDWPATRDLQQVVSTMRQVCTLLAHDVHLFNTPQPLKTIHPSPMTKMLQMKDKLRDLRRGSGVARFLGLRVRIPPGPWMSALWVLRIVRDRSPQQAEPSPGEVLPKVDVGVGVCQGVSSSAKITLYTIISRYKEVRTRKKVKTRLWVRPHISESILWSRVLRCKFVRVCETAGISTISPPVNLGFQVYTWKFLKQLMTLHRCLNSKIECLRMQTKEYLQRLTEGCKLVILIRHISILHPYTISSSE
jgi:hypothetical protein